MYPGVFLFEIKETGSTARYCANLDVEPCWRSSNSCCDLSLEECENLSCQTEKAGSLLLTWNAHELKISTREKYPYCFHQTGIFTETPVKMFKMHFFSRCQWRPTGSCQMVHHSERFWTKPKNRGDIYQGYSTLILSIFFSRIEPELIDYCWPTELQGEHRLLRFCIQKRIDIVVLSRLARWNNGKGGRLPIFPSSVDTSIV